MRAERFPRLLWSAGLLASLLVPSTFGAAVDRAEVGRRLDAEYASLEALYLDLHRAPEISYQEVSTARRVADETDLVKLRTNFRGEQVYLYPLAVPLDAAKAVFVEYLRAATDLREHPQWYNALTDNCTTTLIGRSRHAVNPQAAFDWRWVVNGHLHEVMYERGTIDNSLPLPELRQRCYINDRARCVEDDAGFSSRIRTP